METLYSGYDFGEQARRQMQYQRELERARELSAEFHARADVATVERVRGEISANLWNVGNICKILQAELDNLPQPMTVGELVDTEELRKAEAVQWLS